LQSQEHWCSSGFANTDLDLQLKNHGIHKLIVVGLIANTKRMTAFLICCRSYETWKYIAPIQKAAREHKIFEYGTWGGEIRSEFEPKPGDFARMSDLSQEQRRAWVSLLLETADEVGLPDDPEFRASLVGYLEWGSRLAVINSREERASADTGAPMPSWTWSSPGGPYRP
jgi:hypothetical protein